MSGTVMKFGPQWIRTLTDGAAPSSTNNNSNNNNQSIISTTSTNNNNNNSSSSAATNHNNLGSGNLSCSFNNNNSNSNNSSNGAAGKYKLAEYRYGREEMLALYEQEMEAPDDIRKFTDLYVEKARTPMAMTQMSEEEVKLSTRNWNSEAVLRSSGKIAASNAAAAAAAAAASGGANSTSGGIPAGGTLGGGGGGGIGSAINDRDNRQLSERGGTLTAAGVLSSSPRGPPGALSRIPIEQRGLLSLNSRGPSTIRNLVGRSPVYTRSQSHDDEGVDDGAGGGGAGSNFDSRFGLPGQSRQPNSLRARFEPSRTAGGGAPSSKPIDIKSGNTIDGELSSERRSVFDRLPNKYSVDDKIVRKDVNGRPIQSGDWRSREWSGTDGRGAKVPAEDRSWRSSRGGAAEDWRSNNSSTTSSSWYVRTDDQRNLRTGAPQNQENLNSGFSGKRDTLRRPSADERGDEDDDVQPRHRRDSLPEWSVGDPLSGDKVGSFDATGAFREIAREDGSDSMGKEKSQQDQSGYDLKSNSGGTGQEWRLKTTNSSATYKISDSRNLDAVNSSTNLGELEKLSLLDRNAVSNRDNTETARASNESRTKASGRREPQSREIQERFTEANYQNSIHNQLTGNKIDLQTRTSPPSSDNDHKKPTENSRNSASPQSCQRLLNQSLPPNIQQMLKKQQQQTNQNHQQSFLSAIAGSSNAMQPPNNDDDGFAHLERAAEIMVDQWTAEEEHDASGSPAYFANKLNLTREQQDAQSNTLQNNAGARLPNRAKQQQQSGSEQTSANSSAGFDSNNQKKFILLPFNHEDSQQWFYRDTQGVIQGPFSATEMFEWYKAGYFVKELLVRRACDELFYPLGEVIKMWDRIPFAPIPINIPPPPPITGQALLQFRAVTKQLEMAVSLSSSQGQIPPNAFGITHPGTVLLHGPIIQQQQQQQQQQHQQQQQQQHHQQQQRQVHQVLAAAPLNQNISNPQEQQSGIRQILEATRQHDQSMAQQRTLPGNVQDQNGMQTQLRNLLAQLKNREDFSDLNTLEQQELIMRQFAAARAVPGGLPEHERAALLQRTRMMPFLPFFSSEQERFQHQQRIELERQKEEAEKQGRFMMEQRMKAEEEKQRIMDERQQRKQKEENERHRQEAEKERLLKLSQLKQQQLAKQQEEFRQQMQNQQRLQQQQQEKKQQQQQIVQLNSVQLQQQQQIERAKKAAQAQQVQQEQQRKTAWSTVSKPDQEPVSLATLQKMQEEEKEKERERQRQIQQQIQSNQQQQQQLQQQLQRQMTWANAAQQSKAAPIKTLAEIQKEEEERLAREKQKLKTKIQPTVPNAGVWNNAASHLSWKNPPADS